MTQDQGTPYQCGTKYNVLRIGPVEPFAEYCGLFIAYVKALPDSSQLIVFLYQSVMLVKNHSQGSWM